MLIELCRSLTKETLKRKLKIENTNITKTEVISSAPEGEAIPAPLVTFTIRFWNNLHYVRSKTKYFKAI
jgi:hypothetical protein